jgi:predicted nuclease of restriction endonuclease-like RecB superfamily
VFPSELMIARKTKNGLIFPIFLSGENSDYIDNVLDIFTKNIGNKKEIIEKNLKELEAKSSNNKIIRAISTVIYRNSIFEPPVSVNAPELRYDVFKAARIPPLDYEEKIEILKDVMEKYGLTYDEIISGLYADRDNEQVLRAVKTDDVWQIARIYNLEQIETILMKCTELRITEASDWNYALRSIKLLGLLYETHTDGENLNFITVTGPVSIFENTERYGTRFAMLIEKLYKMDKWAIDADIKIKDKYDKSESVYKLKIGDNVSYYLPDRKINEDTPSYSFLKKAEPLIIKNNVYFPDYIINIDGKDVYINISNLRYLKQDSKTENEVKKYVNWENVYVLRDKEKMIPGSICFYNDIDFNALKRYLEEKYSNNISIKKEIDEYSINEIKKNIEKLYPDTEKIINYIESEGLIPERLLPALGYKLKWRGLDLIIVKK